MKIFNDDKSYRPDEVAVKMQISIKSVYRNINNIKDPLPAFRTRKGGRLRLHGKDLNKYIERHKVIPWEE